MLKALGRLEMAHMTIVWSQALSTSLKEGGSPSRYKQRLPLMEHFLERST